MPQEAWDEKRERQYEHTEDALEERGRPGDEAQEIAARTVNTERAGHQEAGTASPTSTEDMPSSRRGGLRSHKDSGGPTYDQLYDEARHRNVPGRSKMNKEQLARALGRAS